MASPNRQATRIDFSPYDVVRVCIPAPADGSTATDIVLEGTVDTVATKTTFHIEVENLGKYSPSLLQRPGQILIQKTTPFGLMEFDATARTEAPLPDPEIDEDRPKKHDKLTMVVNLVGTQRQIQRRSSWRIEVSSEARYRNLSQPEGTGSEWKKAELHDVSLGGAAILLRNEDLQVGHELLVELSLSESMFEVPAVVCRIERRQGSTRDRCGLKYLDFDPRQQNRMARAITQAQLKRINSRIPID